MCRFVSYKENTVLWAQSHVTTATTHEHYSLFIVIKMENYIQKIIKGPAKLSVAHWWKVSAYTN